MTRVIVLGLLGMLAGCASLIDIHDYESPPSAVDGGADAGTCPAPDAGPQTLVVTPRGVFTAPDSTDVYFATANSPTSEVKRCSKCGCAVPTSLATIGQPGAIAADDTAVFVTDAVDPGSVLRIDKTTFATTVIPNQITPLGLAIDETNVYWTVLGDAQSIAQSGIYSATKDMQNTKLVAATNGVSDFAPFALAVDDTNVYFTTAPDIDTSNTNTPCVADDAGATFGTVRRTKKAGGQASPDVLATGQACPVSIVVSGDSLYWVNLGAGTDLDGSIWTVAKDVDGGGGATQILASIGRPTSLTAQNGRLFWNSPGGTNIGTCRIEDCGGTASILADDQGNASGVSSDSSGVYWVTLGTIGMAFGDGALHGAPLPPP